MRISKFLDVAHGEAVGAGESGEVPVGAVVVHAPSGMVVGRGGNRCLVDNDPTAHAEIVALRRAAEMLGRPRLDDCDLYVTLEPCPMCAGAIREARIRRLYFGAYDVKGGGVEHGPRVFETTAHGHHPEVYGGLNADRMGELLRTFFTERRREGD